MTPLPLSIVASLLVASVVFAATENDNDERVPGPPPVGPPPVGPPSNAPAVRINGKTVGRREVERRFAAAWDVVAPRWAAADVADPERRALRQKIWTESLLGVVQDELLDQAAARERQEIIRWHMRQSGGAYDETRLLEYFRRAEQADLRRMIASEIAAAGGEREFAEALRRQGRSRDDWEAEIRKELFRRYLLGRELGRIFVSPATVETFYAENPELFRRPTRWRLRRIVLPKSGYGSPAEARQAAAFVHQRLSDGADFAVIARTLAADPPYDKDGGRLSRAGRAEAIAGEFPFEEKAAEVLRDGAFSPVLDRGDSFVIVLREGLEPGGIPPLEAVRPPAEKLALDDLVRRRKADFYAKLKDNAFVEILCPEPPK